ncbi:MAG: asparagine synthase (glutamine-hydrolyzing) [Candidatus Poseidoniales archaeon]|nr:asparagine synthase (glutamine-hydrolyzing) [Candidatus Poseidoniales archaeon]
MCGIAGLLGPDGDDARMAESMASLLNHRGPDGTRSWSESCSKGGIGFGHTRLSIVDIIGSNQPLHSDGGCVLIVNGEIYNHLQIRDEERGFVFRTKGDGESILAAYHSRTDDFSWVQRLNGIWAFALWDSKRELLFLCRDQLGIKPLVRTITDEGTLLFGSEIKCFRAHPAHTPVLDVEALVARIAYEYPLDETTLFQDVHSVQAGTIEMWKLNERGVKLEAAHRWVAEIRKFSNQSWSPHTDASSLLESLTESVADRLMSDVPLGIVLSGGLDSAMVAALAHEASERTGYPLPACWTVAESENNPDWVAAERVCHALDLEHHQHILEENAFVNSLPDLAWHGEDIDFTVLFFQPLFAKMAESVTVGLCGQGADELHAGYPRYRDLEAHRNVVSSRLNASEHPFATSLLSGPIDQPGWRANHNPEVAFSDLETTLQYELDHGQLTNFQLRLVDRHSMAHGLEIRVPFLGSSHIDAAKQLPIHWKLSNSVEKAALREAANLTNLPKDIVNRPKLPAGRATSPTLIDNLLHELKGHADDYANDIPSISRMFDGQPEISLGLRLFRSLHIVDGGLGRHGKGLMSLLEDVD